jgi:hypothetical protein
VIAAGVASNGVLGASESSGFESCSGNPRVDGYRVSNNPRRSVNVKDCEQIGAVKRLGVGSEAEDRI